MDDVSKPGEDHDQRFLTFKSDGRLYAVPAASVTEVVRLPPIARVPQAPRSLMGLANLRGSVLPVASVRALLGRDEAIATHASRLIVLDGRAVALAVDEVSSLVRVARHIYVPGLAWLRRRIWKNPDASPYALAPKRFDAWYAAAKAVDSKVLLQSGARRRDRTLGILSIITSRMTSMTLSLLILHAVGEPITVRFVAGYTVGSFLIYMLSTLVPMGLGISEGGNYELFRALGENPARGVTLVLARRVTQIVYAAIGLVLMTASETVQRARERHRTRSAASDLLAPPAATPLDAGPRMSASSVATPGPATPGTPTASSLTG